MTPQQLIDYLDGYRRGMFVEATRPKSGSHYCACHGCRADLAERIEQHAEKEKRRIEAEALDRLKREERETRRKLTEGIEEAAREGKPWHPRDHGYGPLEEAQGKLSKREGEAIFLEVPEQVLPPSTSEVQDKPRLPTVHPPGPETTDADFCNRNGPGDVLG